MSAEKLNRNKVTSVKSQKFQNTFSAEEPDINSNNEIYERNDAENLNERTELSNSRAEEDNKSTQDDDNSDNETEVKEELKFQIQFNNASGVNRCNYCKEHFDNPLMLLRHKRESHSFPKTLLPLEEIEKYYDYPNRNFCPICKKAIKTNNYRSIFLKHLQTHTYNVFECVICKKKFKRRDHMLNHQKRHVVPIEDFIGGKKGQS